MDSSNVMKAFLTLVPESTYRTFFSHPWKIIWFVLRTTKRLSDILNVHQQGFETGFCPLRLIHTLAWWIVENLASKHTNPGWSCLHDTYKHKSWGQHTLLIQFEVWSCCSSGELYYHLALFTNFNMTQFGGTINGTPNFFCLYRIMKPTCTHNLVMHFQQQLACRKYFNYLLRQFHKSYARLHHSRNVLSFLWQCHTRTVTSGPLMSTRALSLPTVMTTGRLSFTRFLRWPRSSYKVNTGQTNERMSCVKLHSATLVCGLLPLNNLIPQPFASCDGWMSPTLH